MKNVHRLGSLLLAFATTLLIGCNSEGGVGKLADWVEAPKTHKCSVEQHATVERETLFCVTNSGNHRRFCYGTAIMRNCDKIEDGNEPEHPTNDNAGNGTAPRDPGSRMGGTEPRDGGSRMGGEP